ncbi:hypothetical protein ABW19_dt0207356 [Dactylella cylindrospora]|nr:hypothetical protein ABW19_dt0207356 [Dactylella cylindrospora]
MRLFGQYLHVACTLNLIFFDTIARGVEADQLNEVQRVSSLFRRVAGGPWERPNSIGVGSPWGETSTREQRLFEEELRAEEEKELDNVRKEVRALLDARDPPGYPKVRAIDASSPGDIANEIEAKKFKESRIMRRHRINRWYRHPNRGVYTRNFQYMALVGKFQSERLRLFIDSDGERMSRTDYKFSPSSIEKSPEWFGQYSVKHKPFRGEDERPGTALEVSSSTRAHDDDPGEPIFKVHIHDDDGLGQMILYNDFLTHNRDHTPSALPRHDMIQALWRKFAEGDIDMILLKHVRGAELSRLLEHLWFKMGKFDYPKTLMYAENGGRKPYGEQVLVYKDSLSDREQEVFYQLSALQELTVIRDWLTDYRWDQRYRDIDYISFRYDPKEIDSFILVGLGYIMNDDAKFARDVQRYKGQASPLENKEEQGTKRRKKEM